MTAFDQAYDQVQLLVAKFQQNLAHYMSPGYSEAEARQDFIDDFFTALGWDVRHRHQTNPYQQEVKIEKSQSQQNESARKRADYAFYMAPNFKDEVFFAEAKKPSVLIENNPEHYFQTMKYGWNSGCPVCVLTDFEEFAIIDCRQKPELKTALAGKHKTYRYTDYTDKEKFAEIYWLFGREAVAGNSLASYAAALPKLKGKAAQKALYKGAYQAIDDSFLEYIDDIREHIAKAFKKANPELNSEQLTEATQRTVDRLVFIRFLEDKFIEPEEYVSRWKSWKQFITDCRKLDAKYNGVVFKKHFIDEPHFIGADEKQFLDICADISSRNSPYDFNYIPIHILGSIYERFLGKIVVATDKRVRIEEKPEVRKAGGVYYTPKYIVDYIVQNTVGKIIEGLTPKQIAAKRFADIACGSGSFLIGVYDCLLDYHKKYYTDKLAGKTDIDKRSEDYGNVAYADGQWRLTLKLKQDILLNNIYGVDIDAQAVEVTQLSLFLKMLEEETVGTTRQGAFFSKVLPDLSKNIVCGNSLIGWDIMQGQLFENEELKKLNPLDYEAAFPEVMRNGGFDAVVGNPPYVMGVGDNERKYLLKKYIYQEGKPDLYRFFIEKGEYLLKPNGFLSYIIPLSLLTIPSCTKLRKYLLKEGGIEEVIVFRGSVFKDANVNSIIIVCHKQVATSDLSVFFDTSQFPNEDTLNVAKSTPLVLDKREISETSTAIISGQANNTEALILEKIERDSSPLSDFCDYTLGMQVYHNSMHTKEQIEKRVYHSEIKLDESYFPESGGKNLKRYEFRGEFKEFVSYGKNAYNKPAWQFCYKPRILIREIPSEKNLICCYTDTIHISSKAVIIVIPVKIDINFLLAILNSRIIGYYIYTKTEKGQQRLFPRISLTSIRTLPIHVARSTEQMQTISGFAAQMLETKQQLAAAVTDTDKNFLQNKCNSIDRQIDKLVYELYGLTEEEIKIVEESA